MDVPAQVAYADSTFPVKVTAKYTFGENVVGVAVVKFLQQRYYWFEPLEIARPIGPIGPIFPGPQNTVLYTRTIDINSTSQSFIVDIQNDLGINQATYENIIVTVDFTEKVTQKTVSTSAYIQIVPYSYSIVFTDDGSNGVYAPNTELNVKLSIKKSDGTSVML